jgi:hypothetical protein
VCDQCGKRPRRRRRPGGVRDTATTCETASKTKIFVTPRPIFFLTPRPSVTPRRTVTPQRKVTQRRRGVTDVDSKKEGSPDLDGFNGCPTPELDRDQHAAGQVEGGQDALDAFPATRARNPLAADADGPVRAADAPRQDESAPLAHDATQGLSDLESGLGGSWDGVDEGGQGALVAFEAQDPGMSEAWIVGGHDAKIMTSRGDLFFWPVTPRPSVDFDLDLREEGGGGGESLIKDLKR